MSRSMPSPASAILTRVRALWDAAARGARLAIGLPDYQTYVAHMRRCHPNQAPMGRDAFFRDRMHARYGRGRSRCC